ncbi:O-antigen/teichoic acid export membrane protein [Paraburkholderia unamae]|uniref:O-antigen/teichoic acid export membrane protein n=2 Tax=Paraburkholderia unamae TaxID=219649 RepID=A0ABX5KF69_9BURK|nr:O-antigen/teichoic acid export membrane protein [Paraburkholderia unamae]CAG9272589.1 Membrane protein involved in the export of O-antigen and teichoic acid [Paraburkholderia unamae]
MIRPYKMNARTRDAWSMMLLAVSSLGSAAFAFAVQVVLARLLPPESFGHFASALAVITIIAPAVGFGLPAFWLKAYGTEGWTAIRWMDVSVSFVRRSSVLCLIAACLWALAQPWDVGVNIVLLMPALLTQGAIEMAAAKFQLEERFGLVAIWQILQNLGRFGFLVACGAFHAGSTVIALGFGVIGALISIGAWISIKGLIGGSAQLAGHGKRPSEDGIFGTPNAPKMKELWRNAMPFGLASVIFYAYNQSGLVLLSHLGSSSDTAVFSVAITVLSALYLAPTVLFQKLLMPRFHRWAALRDGRLAAAYRTGNLWMVITGLGTAAIAALAVPVVLPLVFGARYTAAVPTVTLMTLCVPFRFLTTSASSVMTTSNLIRVRNYCASAALLFSVILSCALVPLYGLKGAAIATVLGEALWAAVSVASARIYVLRGKGNNMDSELSESSRKSAENVMEASDGTGELPVSVVIPCFNCSRTIERAIASIAAQTARPREVILVDDCSTDGTREFIGTVISGYETGWIKLVKLVSNSGPGKARNVGWSMARQPYIAFLDSDDAWHPRKLEVQCGWMLRNQDVAITGHPVAELDARARFDSIALLDVNEPKAVSRAKVLFSNRFTPSSIVMRSDCSSRFDEKKRHAEDYFMLLGVFLMDGGKGSLFSTPLSYVYKSQFGASSGLSAQLWKIQQGEQDNYLHFRKIGAITNVEWVCFSILSAMKYLRRCVISRKFA